MLYFSIQNGRGGREKFPRLRSRIGNDVSSVFTEILDGHFSWQGQYDDVLLRLHRCDILLWAHFTWDGDDDALLLLHTCEILFFGTHHMGWGGVGRWRSFLHFHTCEPLHVGHASHGVGSGGDAYLLCTTKYYSSTTLYYKADSVQKTPTSTVGSLVSLVWLVRFFPWFVGSLVRWFVGSLVRLFVGSLVRWFVGFVGSLVRWFVGSLVLMVLVLLL